MSALGQQRSSARPRSDTLWFVPFGLPATSSARISRLPTTKRAPPIVGVNPQPILENYSDCHQAGWLAWHRRDAAVGTVHEVAMARSLRRA